MVAGTAIAESGASVTLIQGNGVGTINGPVGAVVNGGNVNGGVHLNIITDNVIDNEDFSFLKEREDEIDEEKMVYKYTPIEGGLLGKKLSSASFEFKLVPKKEGGCVATLICNYETLPGTPIDEGKAKEIKEQSIGLLKKIEQYLLSNPNLYC